MPKASVTAIATPSNDAADPISFEQPWTASVTIVGSAPILFHRFSCDAVEAQARATKGSKARKTDNIESFVYRNDKGELCVPGSYLRGAIIGAARFAQDPRSPRKSAVDLYRAGVVSLTELASLGTKEWDFVRRSRALVQRNAIIRSHPGMHEGWTCSFTLQCGLPEYITPSTLNETIQRAGRLIGIGDYRPTFGRFAVTGFVHIG